MNNPEFTSGKPVVLVFAGNDPTGGAGIQADIESVASQGGHAAPVITALTVQDTNNVKDFQIVDPALVKAQAATVLSDMPVKAVKIGMLGDAKIVEVIIEFLTAYPDLPVVLDPVLVAGGGKALSDEALLKATISGLIPRTTVITPNSDEARRLAEGSPTLDDCARKILTLGARSVLITGTHEKTEKVENRLYANDRPTRIFTCDRLDQTYHGSGCTLASAIAALLAKGLNVEEAVDRALDFTWQSLDNGFRAGSGQALPNRIYWRKG